MHTLQRIVTTFRENASEIMFYSGAVFLLAPILYLLWVHFGWVAVSAMLGGLMILIACMS